MESSTKDQAEGTSNEMEGKVVEVAGELSAMPMPAVEVEAADENMTGSAQERFGQFQKVLGR